MTQPSWCAVALAVVVSGCQVAPVAVVENDGAVVLPSRRIAAAPGLSNEARQVYADAMRGAIANAGRMPERFADLVAVSADGAAQIVEQANRRALSRHPATITRGMLGGVPVIEVVPARLDARRKHEVLLNLHGGAFAFNAGSLSEALPVADAAGMRVLMVDYRMPPAHPYPAALDDVLAVYRALLRDHASQAIGVFGTSAGAALTGSAILRARDEGLPLPGAVAMVSFGDGDSQDTLDGLDPYLSRWGHASPLAYGEMLDFYAPGRRPRDPLIEPQYGDFRRGFPPALLVSATRDMMLGGTVRLHRALRNAGQDAELEIWDGLWHGFNADALSQTEIPEAMEAARVMASFFHRRLR
jgi:acetyl esterase/lipase